MLALFRKVKQILRLYKAFLHGNFGLFGTKLLFEMRDKILGVSCLSIISFCVTANSPAFIDGVTCILFLRVLHGAVPFLGQVQCLYVAESINICINSWSGHRARVDAFLRDDVSAVKRRKQPLQGTKLLLVTVAMSRSRGNQ